MKTLLIIAALFCVYKLITSAKAHRAEQAREEAESRRQAEAQRMREEWRRTQAEAKLAIQRQEAMWKEQERQRKEQERQAREQERQAREQERQAAQLERHEEMLMKLDHRLASAESEIAFNREHIERLFKLQEFEISARDACSYGSADWQKHERKVISLENQIHTIQKRIDKAKADKRYCESKLA
ncbi:MAG: hypothetical protein IIZ78_07005 [Clostridiales bacterium]|nr:hypothetical protein [Clostridiales bacterium]